MAWTTDEITTERLLLRCLTNNDWPVLERVLTDVDVRRFLGGPVDDELLTKLSTSELGDQHGAFAVVVDQLVVGTVSIDHERDDRELSYQLLPEHWGNGYAEEASRAVLDWAWRTTDSPSLIAVTQTANARSLGLLDRLGFAFETTFIEYDAEQTQVRIMRSD
mgnify:CR=1 FL=1